MDAGGTDYGGPVVALASDRRPSRLLVCVTVPVLATALAAWTQWLATGGYAEAVAVGLVATGVVVPAVVAAAVLRYRLDEIDRLLCPALVVIVLGAGLLAIFSAVSSTLAAVLGTGSTLPTAAGTLAAALAFRPLRARAQELVDKRVSRARYDARRLVEAHLEEVRTGRASTEAIGDVLAAALDDPTLELLFWIPDSAIHVDAEGRNAVPAADAERDVTPVRRGELPLGAVVHDRRLSRTPDVLETVITAAGLAIEIARLRAEVAHRLAEVEESRGRLVAATDEERRRLERELHDGAQQRLVSIGLALRNVQGRLPDGEERARSALDGTVSELAAAIGELRELARGVRPACLDDGLAAALRELAARSPVRTEIEATAERFDERVEATAFFVASEALTNTIKHARATRAQLIARREHDRLIITISDDGVGGALASQRSGLTGIGDRVSALGGSLRVESHSGRGTTITAELPCGS